MDVGLEGVEEEDWDPEEGKDESEEEGERCVEEWGLVQEQELEHCCCCCGRIECGRLLCLEACLRPIAQIVNGVTGHRERERERVLFV